MKISCFKAYDVRGRVPVDLSEEVAYRIGRAFADFLRPQSVVVGQDVRPSSAALARALTRGLTEGGADVLDIGLCGTEEVYFATAFAKAGGGIMVTASHNPADWNGLKLVREGSRPISGDTGLDKIRALAERGDFTASPRVGTVTSYEHRPAYLRHLLKYVDHDVLLPLKIVVNAGNGCAGPVIDLLAQQLPFAISKIHNDPMAFPTRCSPRTAVPPARRCWPMEPPWGSPGTVTSTVASSLTSAASSSRGTTSSVCWRRPTWPSIPVPRSSMTRA